jgi:hypothetical protein
LIDTKYEKIHIGKPGEIDYIDLKKSLDELCRIIKSSNNKELIEMVKNIVPTYRDNIEVNNENQNNQKKISHEVVEDEPPVSFSESLN